MRFIITFLTRRASGRVTRRSTEVEKDELSFGRATSSDVYLPDLRVGLGHARLTVAGGRVRMEALGERPLRVRSSPVNRTDFALDNPSPVRLGPYALSFGETGSGAVEVTVELVEPPTEALSPQDEDRLFSLTAALPGKRMMSWVLFLAVAVVFLVMPVLHAQKATGRFVLADLATVVPEQVERLRDAVASLPVPLDGWKEAVGSLPIPTESLDAAITAAVTIVDGAFDRVGAWIDRAPGPGEPLGVPIDALPLSPEELRRIVDKAAWTPDHVWDPGPVSRVHANIAASCTTCHQKPFEAVKDETCLGCHQGIRDHAGPSDLATAAGPAGPLGRVLAAVGNGFGLEPGRCAGCHNEHNGDADVVRAHQTFCDGCHATLRRALPGTKLGDASDFGVHHPQFHPTVPVVTDNASPGQRRWSLDDAPKENSGLKFSHAQHLDTAGGVTRMARELGTARGFGGPLACANCHRPDAAKALFEPISMERHCSTCHDLTFDLDDGHRRVLPHGQPKDVEAVLRDHYLGQELERLTLESREPDTSQPVRRRPGERAVTLAPEEQKRAFMNVEQATAKALDRAFSADRKGLCVGCHDVTREAMAAFVTHKIAPVRLADRYMPLARFDHGKHDTANLECASCHAATTSKASSDVLLPGIGSVGDLRSCGPTPCACRNCHAGEDTARATPSPCLTCHRYHGGYGAPLMTPARREARSD